MMGFYPTKKENSCCNSSPKLCIFDPESSPPQRTPQVEADSAISLPTHKDMLYESETRFVL
jgi:hypothetical protein